MDHKLEFEPKGGSGSYKMTQTANVIVGDKAEKRDFESQWTGVSKALKKIENIVRVKGEVIVGNLIKSSLSYLQKQSFYITRQASMVKLFSPPRVNSPPLKFLDQLKEENLDPFIKSLVFLRIVETMQIRPEEWGLENVPKSEFSLFEDYQRLRVLVAGLDLVAEWYLFISKREGSNKRGEIISFFENISDFSYWKEARFQRNFLEKFTIFQF